MNDMSMPDIGSCTNWPLACMHIAHHPRLAENESQPNKSNNLI